MCVGGGVRGGVGVRGGGDDGQRAACTYTKVEPCPLTPRHNLSQRSFTLLKIISYRNNNFLCPAAWLAGSRFVIGPKDRH